MIKFFQPNTILLILTAICFGAPGLSEAKGFKFYGQSFLFGSGSNECDRSVESIGKLTELIVKAYTEDLADNKDCVDCKALHKQILVQKNLVNRLIKASKVEDKEVFRNAAREVETSTRKLVALKGKANVSRKVDDMILKYSPLILRIKGCAGSFDVAIGK